MFRLRTRTRHHGHTAGAHGTKKAMSACESYNANHTTAARARVAQEVLPPPRSQLVNCLALAPLTRSHSEVYAAGGVVHEGAIHIVVIGEPPCIQVSRMHAAGRQDHYVCRR